MENIINKNKSNKKIYSFFPKNKRLRLSKQNLKYLTKEKNVDTSDNQDNINKNNLSRKTKVNEKTNQANSYSKNRLTFNYGNYKWNYNCNYNINSSKPKYNIASTTSFNFWKGTNNNKKFKLNNFIKKSSNNRKSAKMRANNMMNINRIKVETGSSVEQKYALNSKLFEYFINQYEKKIKKALFDIGINPDEKYNDTNKDSYINEYDNNYNNLPFLNNNNNEQMINNLNSLKTKKKKILSSYNLHLENNHYFEEKASENDDTKNNNLMNSTNSNNGNNNIIFHNTFKKNLTNNIDNDSCNTKVNTKSHTINSIISAKGKENKKIISAESTCRENNNNNLKILEKINIEKSEKRNRAISTNPYSIKTTINENQNNNLELRNYHYYNNNNSNISTNFKSKNWENDLSNYEIGHTLGKGAYAIVKVCTNKITKEKFAMKIYEKSKLNDSSKKKCVYREIEILKRINHNNIAKLYDVITTDKQILILQELVIGISLREYYNKEIRNQKGISEHKSNIFKKIFKQIFEAMNYIHIRNMAHRDIKLENILMTKNYDIKIIDFGFGMYNPQNKLQNFYCGTPNYMPPEIIVKKPYNGQKADLWSLGILVYKMFCADFPFKGKNEKELYKAIEKGKFKLASYTPDYVKKIIFGMIELNPDKRMSCANVLKSDWLRD